jgi:AraC family transcriptional regulator
MLAIQECPEVISRITGMAPECMLQGLRGDVLAARWNHRPGYYSKASTPTHVLVYHLSGNTQVERLRNGVVTGFRSRVGSVTFMSSDAESDWHIRGETQVLHLYLGKHLFDGFARSEWGAAVAPPIEEFFSAEDPWLDGMFRMLMSETTRACGRSTPTPSLDHLQPLVVRHLLTRYARAERRSSPPSGGEPAGQRAQLRQHVLHRISALIQERLDTDIRLKDLADLACLSKDHFLRAFRDTVGQTPYHYVLTQRLERARHLLRQEPDLPIAEIALRCGFKNVSHFSTTFKRTTGSSPREFRG